MPPQKRNLDVALHDSLPAATRRRAKNNATAYAKVEEFRQFFKDPPDIEPLSVQNHRSPSVSAAAATAASLSASTSASASAPVPVSATATITGTATEEAAGMKSVRLDYDLMLALTFCFVFYLVDIEGTDEEEVEEPSSRSRSQYRRLQFNGRNTNMTRIFLAVQFLEKNLRSRARPEDTKFRFKMTKEAGSFRALARDLELEEPRLKGVTGYALHSVYERMVEKRRELEAFLSTATGDPWAPTKMSDMAWNLVLLDEDVRLRDQRQAAEREGIIAEAEAKENRAIVRATTTIGPRKNKAGTDPDPSHPAPSSVPEPPSDCADQASTSRVELVHPPATTSDNAPSTGTTGTEFVPPRLHRSGSSVSSKSAGSTRSVGQSTVSLFSIEEQEAFKDYAQDRMTAIGRAVQDVSTDLSTRTAAFEARIQSIEEKAMVMEEKVKAMEGMVKDMKGTLARFTGSFQVQIGEHGGRLEYLTTTLGVVLTRLKQIDSANN
ncbi:hypothetical protein B0O80DRAFT_459923 [Mortierella sp. GBAus27b]|nr:hypothetical protein B0O80DRAFT_459923 [Mortierella sp. GBAus27b]